MSLNARQTVTNQADYIQLYVIHTAYSGQKADAKSNSITVTLDFICTFQIKAIKNLESQTNSLKEKFRSLIIYPDGPRQD